MDKYNNQLSELIRVYITSSEHKIKFQYNGIECSYYDNLSVCTNVKAQIGIPKQVGFSGNVRLHFKEPNGEKSFMCTFNNAIAHFNSNSIVESVSNPIISTSKM